MSVALASTWIPRGELSRLQRLVSQLRELYCAAVIVMPPQIDSAIITALEALPDIQPIRAAGWNEARHVSVEQALETGAEAIHYSDFDRLLHWLECYPAELRSVVEQARTADCLVTGRTRQAWATHPRCMIETEALFNMVFSHLLGAEMDVGAGSKTFSRAAATYLAASGLREHWAVDAAWPLLLQRAGYRVDYRAVDGLEWETPDQHREQAADAATRERIAAEHDRDPAVWQQRMFVAHEIMRVGLLAAGSLPP